MLVDLSPELIKQLKKERGELNAENLEETIWRLVEEWEDIQRYKYHTPKGR